ncbi:MAG TPA: lasso peptide biosynthesis B2 protein [Caulobacteraceae bacterium]
MILRKLNTLVRMDRLRRGLMVEAVLWLAVARVALLVLPFRVVARRLGKTAPPASAAEAGADGEALAKAVGWTVQRMAGYVPFRAVCLQQALAAKMMLRRRGVPSVLHLGVASSSEGPLSSHAWLDVGQAKVTGYPIGSGFTEVVCFI